MRSFTAGLRSTNGTINQAAVEIIASAAKGFRLVDVMTLSLAAATASTFGFGRPAAAGITPTTPARIAASDGGGVQSEATTALAWATSPTNPALNMWRVTLPATIGAFVPWQLPSQGIWVPAGGTIVLQNLAANGVCDFVFTLWE